MKSKSIFPYPLAVLAICLWLILLNVPLALAQGNYVPLAPIDVEGSEFTSPTYTYPGDTRADKTCTAPTCFPRYLRTLYNIGIALAGFFAVFSIVRGGFELLFTDSILGHTEAKGIILRAIGGLIVVYGSYILMNTINPQLARDLSLNFQTLKPPEASFGDLSPPITAAERIQQIEDKLNKQITDNNTKIQDWNSQEAAARAAGNTFLADSIHAEQTLFGDFKSKSELANNNLKEGLNELWVNENIAAAKYRLSQIYGQSQIRATTLLQARHQTEADEVYKAASAAYNELKQQIEWKEQGCDRTGFKNKPGIVGGRPVLIPIPCP